MHEDEEERLVKESERKKKHERAIFLGQECKIKKRKVRFEKTYLKYDHKGKTSVEKICTTGNEVSRNRKPKGKRVPFNFTKSEVEARRIDIKEEEKSARKRSFNLYAEVSAWLRKEASKDHSKLMKWIAKKYPKITDSKRFYVKGEERALIIEMERNWILDSGASDHVIWRKELTPREVQSLCSWDKPQVYSTANGKVSSSKVAKVWIKSLGIHVWAMVFNHFTPSLLSMGKLVKEFDARVTWDPEELVFAMRGKQISIPSLQNVPTIAIAGGTRSEIGDSDEEDEEWQHTSARESSHANSPMSARESSLDEPLAVPSQSEESEEQAEKRRAKSRRIKRAARWGNAKTTGMHNQFTHFPRDANCPVCNETKVQKARCATNPPVEADSMPQAKAFADRITADHAILNDEDGSRTGDMVAMVIQDEFSKWIQAYPADSKNSRECMKAFQRFLGPYIKAKHVFTDNSRE